MLNTIVNTKRILIDNQVEMEVSVDPSTENTLYCRPFEEDIHNICTFTVKDQEFIYKYDIGLDNKTYINANVITEDGDEYSDVRFKVVVIENGDLPFCTFNTNKNYRKKVIVNEQCIENIISRDRQERAIVNTQLLEKNISNQNSESERYQEKNIVATQHIENLISEEVNKYKQDLLKEFLALTEVHQKHIAQNVEQFEQLKENIDTQIELSLSTITKDAVQDMLCDNKEIANALVEKFKIHKNALKEQTTEIINKSVQNVNKQLSSHEENVINLIKPRIEETAIDILKEKIETIESLLSLDKKVNDLVSENTNLKQTVTQLTGERQALKVLVESSKSYTDTQIAKYAQDARDYARRILELGSGGGTVAVQYVNGGIMDGDLDVRGNILSGGNNLVNVFAGEGGGDDNPINGGIY